MSDIQFTDGYLGVETEVSVVPAIVFPFAGNPIADTWHRRVVRQYQVAPRSFVPRIAMRTSYTNLLPYSEDYTNAAWTKTNITVTAGAAPNPVDGQRTLSHLTNTSANSEHRLAASVTVLAAPMVLSAYFKYITLGRGWVVLRFQDAASVDHLAYFNITTGEVGATAGLSSATVKFAGIDVDGNSYYKCTIFFVPGAGAGTLYVQNAFSNGVLSYIGTAGQVQCGLFDVELSYGSTVNPYIPATSALRTVSCPDLDPEDNLAVLVGESDLAIENSARALFTRIFARVPAPQVLPGTKYITRPVMHDIKSAAYYAVSFDEKQKFSWIFGTRKSVSSIASLADSTTADTNTRALLPSGQTVSCSGTGGSSSFSTSDSIATIQAALGTAWGFAWILVTKDAYSITARLTYSGAGGGHITSVGSGSSSIEIQGPPDDFKIVSKDTTAASTTPNLASSRNVASTLHGGAVGNRVALWRGDKLISIGTVVVVPDANNFTVELDAIPGKDDVITHCGFSANATLCVVNGTIMCSVRRTQRFYLPGFSAGITTFADIPVAGSQQDPISWLAAIIASSAWTVESVSELQAAAGLGPILMQETLEVQMSDAIDVVTP